MGVALAVSICDVARATAPGTYALRLLTEGGVGRYVVAVDASGASSEACEYQELAVSRQNSSGTARPPAIEIGGVDLRHLVLGGRSSGHMS